jgi:hypothetical protein
MDGRWPIGQGRRRRIIWKRECVVILYFCADSMLLLGKNETQMSLLFPIYEYEYNII